MTCRDIEPLMLAERDGALTPTERAVLSNHVATCPACRQFRTQLAASLETYRASAASVAVPDVDEAWRDLRAQLREPARPAKKRPLAPVIWFGAPLAAAAALAFAFRLGSGPSVSRLPAPASVQVAAISAPPPPPPPSASAPAAPYDSSIIAGADYVEAGDPNASTMVYVDKESGWLVVWATDAGDTETSG